MNVFNMSINPFSINKCTVCVILVIDQVLTEWVFALVSGYLGYDFHNWYPANSSDVIPSGQQLRRYFGTTVTSSIWITVLPSFLDNNSAVFFGQHFRRPFLDNNSAGLFWTTVPSPFFGQQFRCPFLDNNSAVLFWTTVPSSFFGQQFRRPFLDNIYAVHFWTTVTPSIFGQQFRCPFFGQHLRLSYLDNSYPWTTLSSVTQTSMN